MPSDHAGSAGSRRGFTLIEVVIALAIAGTLLLGARWVISASGDAAERLTAEAGRVDRNANAERLARELAARTELRPGGHLRGDRRGARWSTWCDVPSGWQERCEVTLAVLATNERRVVAIAFDDGRIIPVRDGFSTGSLIYLESATAGGVWVGQWTSETAPPLAVGVVADRDTLVLRIGDRG